MVLTKRQRGDLHAGIYEYLLSQEGPHFDEAAAALAEADPSCVRSSGTPLSRQTSTTSNGSVSLSHLLSNGNTTAPPIDADDMSVSSRLSLSSRYSTLSMRSTSSSSANLPVLERKWTAVPRLQKKVLELERTLAANAKLFAHRGTGGGMVAPGSNVERRKLPRPPCSHTLQGHSGVVSCVAIHPTFTLAVSGSEDGTIKVWDHESGEYSRTLKGHTNTVHSLVFSPTGSHLASSSSDLSIKLWDFGTYSCIRTLRGHDHSISMVRFLPLPKSSMMERLEQQKKAVGGDVTTTTGMDATTAGASHLISVSRDTTVKVWDIETGFCAQTLTHHSDWVRCLAVRDSDGERLATAGNEQAICVFALSSSDLAEGEGPKEIGRLEGHDHVIESLSFVTSKSPAVLAGETVKETKEDNTTTKVDYLASAGRDRTVRLWNIGNFSCISVFKYHENWVRSVLIHPSGKYILSAGDDRTIRVMDISSQRCLRTIQEAHPHFVTCIAMHPSLPIMVSGGVDQKVKCWQLD